MTTARSILLPYDYAPPQQVGNRMRTCRLVDIGLLYEPAPVIDSGVHAERVQRALLAPPSLWERIRTEAPMGKLASVAVTWALGTGLIAAVLDVLWWHP